MRKFYFLILISILSANTKLEIEIKKNLISPCCWAGTIYDLDHNPEIEEKIRELIKLGLKKNGILDYFVSIHGKRILAIPEAKGFNMLIWIVPIMVAISSLLFISIFFLKQNNK